MDIVVTAQNDVIDYVLPLKDGEKKKVTIDYRPWAEANEDIVSVTVSKAYEDLTLLDNVASFVVSEGGRYEITATTLNLVGKLYLRTGEASNEDYI